MPKPRVSVVQLLSVVVIMCAIAPGVRAADLHDALQASEHKTFASAVQAAGLADALKGKGPMTVFVPSDIAFDKLDEDTLPTLLEPDSKAELGKLVRNHIVSGRALFSGDISQKPMDVQADSGDKLSINNSAWGTKVDDATVVKGDIKASNGVIHVIDTVLVPASLQDWPESGG